MGVDRGTADQPLVELELAEGRRAALAAAPMISGPIPSPGRTTMWGASGTEPDSTQAAARASMLRRT